MSEEDFIWIGKHELLVERFGYWPSFHDAEVRRFEFVRGPMIPEEDQYGDAAVLVTFFLFEYSDSDESGCLHRQKLTLATFRFRGVERLTLENWGQYRDINELVIVRRERDDGPSPYFSVEFEKFPYGYGASFQCYDIDVVAVEGSDEYGRAIRR